MKFMRTLAAVTTAVLLHAVAAAQTPVLPVGFPDVDTTRWIGAIPLGEGVPDSSPPGASALERYVAFDDGAYAWSKAKEFVVPGGTVHVLRLTSQRWRPDADTSHPIWTHYLTIGVPDTIKNRTPVFIIGGGRRRTEPASSPPGELVVLLGAGSVVAYLDNVPNQPLTLENDGRERFEDDLLARTWVIAARDNDATWIGRFPMVKAAVRGMDATEEFLATLKTPEGGARPDAVPDGFFVVGASKRGWTTWLTGAIDPRVKALAPMVIDVLNMQAHTPHHYMSYGFWAPALRDYEANGIPAMFGTPELARVIAHEDPLFYLSRIGERPVYVVNAGGDEFFPTDSLRHYESSLPPGARVRVVPNVGHSMRAGGPGVLLDVLAFYQRATGGGEIPRVSWSVERGERADTVTVRLSQQADSAALWQVTNPKARDFRFDQTGPNWKSTPLQVGADPLTYTFELAKPQAGWQASMAAFIFRDAEGGALPVTTRVFITPDTLPHTLPARNGAGAPGQAPSGQ
ncbi:MAG: PhoPQ-activated protein PqaA family protein [Planctomycetota bacterium]|nr:PhoPQ-activated protein PqaA family protein [Planctomycetota bacterium]